MQYVYKIFTGERNGEKNIEKISGILDIDVASMTGVDMVTKDGYSNCRFSEKLFRKTMVWRCTLNIVVVAVMLGSWCLRCDGMVQIDL